MSAGSTLPKELKGVKLRRVNLVLRDLSDHDLTGADLTEADLTVIASNPELPSFGTSSNELEFS